MSLTRHQYDIAKTSEDDIFSLTREIDYSLAGNMLVNKCQRSNINRCHQNVIL